MIEPIDPVERRKFDGLDMKSRGQRHHRAEAGAEETRALRWGCRLRV